MEFTVYCSQHFQRAEQFIFSRNVLKVLFGSLTKNDFNFYPFTKLEAPVQSKANPKGCCIRLSQATLKHSVLILGWDTVCNTNVMQCYSKLLWVNVASTLWWSTIFPWVCVCLTVLNKAALLHNNISKGMCDGLCVRAKPHGEVTQAEDPVKYFIFRCVKLLHFSSLSLSLYWDSLQLNPFQLQIKERLQYHVDVCNTACSTETDLQMGQNYSR